MHVVVLKFKNLIDDTLNNRIFYILSIVHTVIFGIIIAIFQMQISRKARLVKGFLARYTEKLRQSLVEKLTLKPFKMEKRDIIAVGIILSVYTCLLFFNLGSWTTPQLGLEFMSPQSGVEVVFKGSSNINTIIWYDAEGQGELLLENYVDGRWQNVTSISCQDYYVLRRIPFVIEKVDRLRLLPNPAAGHINEIAFLDRQNKPIPIKSVISLIDGRVYPAAEHPLFNEQSRVLEKPSYMNSTYFDEIYHGRTAYEFVKGTQVYETTHPPLGKDILSLGILIFGMNPFGLRFMHAIAGIFLILVLFLLGRQILATRFGAYCIMLLGVLDFMPFVQSRYSTIDTTSVLFITTMFLFTFKYIREQLQTKQSKISWGTLALIMFFFALAVSVKWTAPYGFVGVITCIALVKISQYLTYRNERTLLIRKERSIKASQSKNSSFKLKNNKELNRLSNKFWFKNFWPTVLVALLLFVLIVPLIYHLSYIPFLNSKGIQDVFSEAAVQEVLNSQRDMYDYHSKLVATHPFASSWWSWPFDFKPLWIYGNEETPGYKGSIVSMGNPLIWFLGLCAVMMLLYQLLLMRRFSIMHFVMIGFFSLYLPWILVSRITYIYHFYPPLPFYLLFVAFILEPLWNMGKPGRKIVFTIIAISLGLFVIFYPVLSGLEVPRIYIDHLHWFPKDWIF